MRLKHIKNADVIISNSKYVVNTPLDFKGKWNELFGNNNPIEIEIGTGKGKFIIDMAMKNPNINYIGIEKYDSPLVSAVKKLENIEILNLKLVCFDALGIENLFDREVSKIYLNFSDPWPKKRHAKRRLTSSLFLDKYDLIFKKEKKIFQKTDNIDLFAYSVESLSNHGYVLKNVTMDLYKNEVEGNVKTEYEKKFIEKNIKICRLEAYKR